MRINRIDAHGLFGEWNKANLDNVIGVGDVIVEVGGVRPADSAAVLAGRGQQAAVWRPPRGWSPP